MVKERWGEERRRLFKREMARRRREFAVATRDERGALADFASALHKRLDVVTKEQPKRGLLVRVVQRFVAGIVSIGRARRLRK